MPWLKKFWDGASGGAAELAEAGRLGMDFHSHLLPGVDDGMPAYQDALAAIDGLTALGFGGAVLTPHIYRGVFDNESGALRAAFAAFTETLAADGIDFPLYLAAEYFADENFLRLIEQDDILSVTVGDERWVMLEFPFLQETPFAGVCLSALAARGYRPVIAHVERYRFVAQATQEWLDRFARAGAVLQGDIGSLVGQYGEDAQRLSNWLAERDLIAIWGTDLHRPAHLDRHIVPGLAKLAAAGRPAKSGVLNEALAPLAEGWAA
jgi:tyrosine-protein phosphatase YwqE